MQKQRAETCSRTDSCNLVLNFDSDTVLFKSFVYVSVCGTPKLYYLSCCCSVCILSSIESCASMFRKKLSWNLNWNTLKQFGWLNLIVIQTSISIANEQRISSSNSSAFQVRFKLKTGKSIKCYWSKYDQLVLHTNFHLSKFGWVSIFHHLSNSSTRWWTLISSKLNFDIQTAARISFNNRRQTTQTTQAKHKAKHTVQIIKT